MYLEHMNGTLLTFSEKHIVSHVRIWFVLQMNSPQLFRKYVVSYQQEIVFLVYMDHEDIPLCYFHRHSTVMNFVGHFRDVPLTISLSPIDQDLIRLAAKICEKRGKKFTFFLCTENLKLMLLCESETVSNEKAKMYTESQCNYNFNSTYVFIQKLTLF